MCLPQELVDKILGCLPLDDKQDQQSLRNCSLVAKSWINPSQRRLFETVVITEVNRQSWLKNISPTNVELLQHIRSLSIGSSETRRLISSPEYTDLDDLYDYFSTFHRLHTIKLFQSHISPDISEQMEIFFPCQQSLSSLTFDTAWLQWRSFITIIDYFPNLRNLELRDINFGVSDRSPPPLSRPLCGRLGF